MKYSYRQPDFLLRGLFGGPDGVAVQIQTQTQTPDQRYTQDASPHGPINGSTDRWINGSMDQWMYRSTASVIEDFLPGSLQAASGEGGPLIRDTAETTEKKTHLEPAGR
ncbi:hypothetical protein EYF80_062426 [Liparis tanakae]|uniref:Uncharacterized protein n=1 Tax=Liparis tanakae TaxID=230148 RepID=A0A4Z2EFW1_9TELE|nr:hypothetical protein EYF80_062426 [Liparis tanakae]